VPINCELKLEVWDSPNSAGVVIDAVRCAKLALDRGLSGALVEPSSYFMKSPPQQFTDDEARQKTEAFILGDDEFVAPPIPKRNGHSNGNGKNKPARKNGTRSKR
jgi:myo-inositol-1-phosphate synthase